MDTLQEEQHSPRRGLWVGVISVIIIGIVSVGAWYLYNTGAFSMFSTQTETPTSTYKEPRGLTDRGRIYLTLNRQPGGQSARVGDLYAFDLENEQLEKADAVFDDRGFVRYGGTISPDGTEFAYFASLRDAREGNDYAFVRSLSLVFLETDETEEGEAIHFEDNDVFVKSGIAWSPDGRYVAYEGFTGSAADNGFERYANWSVFLFDQESGEITKIGIGGSPKWSPDGSVLLFLNEDGINAYRLETGDTQVAAAFGSAQRERRFDISNDGKLLVTNSGKTLQFFRIVSWDPLRVEIGETVKLEGDVYWPTFSPDGTQVACILQRATATAEYPRVSLYTFDRSTEHAQELYRLDEAFIPEGNMISDWY